MVRVGLCDSLAAEPDMVVVGDARTGADAVRMAQEHQPDVMLLDVKLEDMDGPDVCRRVLTIAPEIAVVMLTGHTQEGLILRSLAAGAKGYMIKDVELAELKRAIRSVRRGVFRTGTTRNAKEAFRRDVDFFATVGSLH